MRGYLGAAKAAKGSAFSAENDATLECTRHLLFVPTAGIEPATLAL
jgi:hypothetical protein